MLIERWRADTKWSVDRLESMYCLAVCRREDVRSLRDLTAHHLPMLRNLKVKCLQCIREKFGIPTSEVRAYVHYPPSFYHFHVHFVRTGVRMPGSEAGRAHLLDDIIENLEVDPNHYERRCLSMSLGAAHPLFVSIPKTCLE